METLKTAVVGCGRFGEIHASAYARFPRCELLAVCDLDGTRAEDFARRFGGEACIDVERIASDDRIDAVSIATPDFAHREICVRLAEAGKHLLIEKPLATTPEDARAIAAAVESAGVTAMVDFHNRYQPACREVYRQLRSGQIGQAQMLYARLSDRIEVATEWFPWAGRSGPEWFLGSHLADLACWLFDARPRSVYAEGRKDVLAARGIDCYDSMQIHLSMPEGLATLETSWILPPTFPMICDFAFSLQATDGRCDVDMAHQGVTVMNGAEYDKPLLFGATPVGEDEFGLFAFSIHDFVRSALAGRDAPAPLADGVANVELIAAAVQSARTRQPVELPAD